MTPSHSRSFAQPGPIASHHPVTTRRLPRAVVYRRRRLAVGAAAAAVITLVGLGVGGVLVGPGDGPASAAGAQSTDAARTVVAMPGDSLWSIAESAYAKEAGGESVSFQRYFEAVVELNGDTQIDVGQHVRLP